MNREPGPPTDENALIAERRAKLARLREEGVAFPNDFRRDALAADLHATYEGRSDEWLAAHPVRVRVAGRMMFKRLMGKASFAKLQDGSGQVQVYLQAGTLGAAYEAFKGWDVGDIVGGRYTSHFGFAANLLITSSAAVPFSSRIVTLCRKRVEIIRLPVTSARSSKSSCSCCVESAGDLAASGRNGRAGSQ